MNEEERTEYTLGQMSRIIGESPNLLQRWLRRGLLRPVRRARRVAWFDFAELSRARTLKRLATQGVPPRDLAAAIYRAERSAAGPGDIVTAGDEVAIRSPDGTLTNPHGQTLLDFFPDAEPKPRRIIEFYPQHKGRFEEAIAAEDEEDFPLAERIYTDMLREEGPSPEICFNLGNVLYQLDRKQEAVQRYRQAVDMEADYVEAWNNLAVTLAEVGLIGESVDVFLRILDIEPQFAEAMYNLADTYEKQGDISHAVLWWNAYLRVDSGSSIAYEIRLRLARLR